MTADIDDAELKKWIGREQQVGDIVVPSRVNGLNAVLGRTAEPAKPGDVAPHGIHWCLAPHIAPAAEIGPDGHEARGKFLPPVPLPRRMWAGSRIAFLNPFRVGDTVERISKVTGVELKEGRSGPLCFVTVTHVYSTEHDTALIERQDIVYRGGATTASPATTPQHPSATASRELALDAMTLFRYSALTFNGHRIHFDRDYCVNVEGYPGLVVHAPLLATLLLAFAAAPDAELTAFEVRARHPLFDGTPFTMNAASGGDETELWIADDNGTDIMTATVSAA